MLTAESYLEGKILLINKPFQWTSFQAVNKLKYLLREKFDLKKIKIGHAGTLDPLATGLLIVCTGKATKRIIEFQDLTKEYTGTFFIGATTPSYDLETEINQVFDNEHITNELLLATVAKFQGDILQKPPIFSAIQKDGKRLYELAREGKTTEILPRKVTVFEFELTRIALPEIDFRIVCSKGTYIRSIAYDYGLALQSGAHLTALKRTKIGEYTIENAQTPNDFEIELDKLV